MSANHTPIVKGAPVKIIGVAHPQHAHMVGRRGVIHCFVKSRGIYQIDSGPIRWESYPHNVRAVNGEQS